MIWKKAWNSLRSGRPLYLLLVIDSKGSSPGRRGFKMLVETQTAPEGSIGGGLMERQLSEQAQELLRKGVFQAFAKRQVHRKEDPHSSGMICSGEQTVAFIPLIPEKHLTLLREILTAAEGETHCKIRITLSGFELLPCSGPRQLECHFHSETNWQYEESLLPAHEVYIIGAGHVGQATAKLFHFLQCKAHLLDNRPALLQSLKDQTPATLITADYARITQHIPQKSELAILIMTTRYDEDLLVLHQLLNHPCRYLGLLGSNAKVKQIFNSLKSKGIPEKTLQKIHTPIGLPINSKTPEEIAVSIGAEFVKVYREKG